MPSVDIAVIGVGNCASSLVQGLHYYADAGGGSTKDRPGLPNAVCAGYRVADVRVTAAFDVDPRKIGRDLAEAIVAAPNNARVFTEVPPLGVTVAEGVLEDGIGALAARHVDARGDASVEAITEALHASGAAVVVNFLPVGSARATEAYAEASLAAGCAFVNCMPSVVARSPEWAGRYADAGVPLIGDDLKSQFGATLLHRAVLEALAANGVDPTHTYQLLSGGNMDFLALQDPDRLATKQESKTAGMGAAATSSHVGADYNPHLGDRKLAFIRVEGIGFGGTPLEIDLRMAVDDSPSAAGNVLDAVRLARRAMAEGTGGVLGDVSRRYMKAPG